MCVWLGGDAVEGGVLPMHKVLALLANCASLDIIRDPCMHPWPPILVLDLLYCFVPSWMSSSRVVMHSMQDGLFYFLDWWHEYSVRWLGNTVNVFRRNHGYLFVIVVSLIDTGWPG